jgi:hypothetical protein
LASALKSPRPIYSSNCDEFIYYDDLVRVEPAKKRPSVAATAPAAKLVKIIDLQSTGRSIF